MSLIQEALEKAGQAIPESGKRPHFAGEARHKDDGPSCPDRRGGIVKRARPRFLLMGGLWVGVFLVFLVSTHFLSAVWHLRKPPSFYLASLSPQLPFAGKDWIRPPDLRCTGITVDGAESFAIINDRILKVGDSIDGAVVTAIEERSVELRYLGRTFRLTL